VEIRANQIRLGIEAPREVGVMREELVAPSTREIVGARAQPQRYPPIIAREKSAPQLAFPASLG
jgi:sRNA-binding carbon storage regulator CsrA